MPLHSLPHSERSSTSWARTDAANHNLPRSPVPHVDWKEFPSVQLDSLLPKPDPASQEEPVNAPGPPSLEYDWRSRRLSFALNMFALVFFNAILPVIVFYLLFYHSDVDKIQQGNHNILYGATTATMGTLQIPQWFWRWWNCYRLNALFIRTVHTDGEHRWTKVRRSFNRSIECWDVFQWSFLAGIIVGSITLILGTCLNGNYGNWPLMALSPSAIFALIGLALFLVPTCLASWGVRSPISLSGHPAQSHTLPALAYMWPDLTAVDGGGGQAFRQSFDRRWHASPPFRHMVTTLSWAIGIPLLLQLGPEVSLVLIIHHKQWSFMDKARYTWAPAWALLLAVLLGQTLWACIYIRSSFKREKEWWHAMYRGAMHFD